MTTVIAVARIVIHPRGWAIVDNRRIVASGPAGIDGPMAAARDYARTQYAGEIDNIDRSIVGRETWYSADIITTRRAS